MNTPLVSNIRGDAGPIRLRRLILQLEELARKHGDDMPVYGYVENAGDPSWPAFHARFDGGYEADDGTRPNRIVIDCYRPFA